MVNIMIMTKLIDIIMIMTMDSATVPRNQPLSSWSWKSSLLILFVCAVVSGRSAPDFANEILGMVRIKLDTTLYHQSYTVHRRINRKVDRSKSDKS